jgi:putative salt-induced outer membrane protein
MMRMSLAVLGTALLLHGFAHAADSDAGSAAAAQGGAASGGTWAAKGQLGLIMTSGNSTTKSGNASLDVAHRMGRWTLSGGLAALYASTGRYTTQQDTSAHLQADLALSRRTFWFSTARWDRNLFTGFAYQESIASGGGFKFVQTRPTLLAGELGIGYRIERPEILTTDSLGAVTSRTRQSPVHDAVLQAGLDYTHSITRMTKLENTLLVLYGSSDTTTTDNLSLQVKIDASLALAVGMQLVNNTNPPDGLVATAGGTVGSVRHTDTVLTVSLVYEHKNPKLSATAGTPVTVNGFNLP